MQLIIFDLEWNIGYQPKTFDYHGAEQTLRGEIIQIGAVRVDGAGQVLDRFSITMRPRIFRKLQHRIAKVTGMTQRQLDEGVPIREGLGRFLAWCGRDAALAEWGLDDVPVLKQNLYLNGYDEAWPRRWYDLQQVFLAQRPRGEGEGMTLESVVARLGLPMDEAFHDALSDAVYTAAVCRCIDLAAGIAAYPDPAEQLRRAACPEPGEYAGFEVFGPTLLREAWRDDPAMQALACPQCGASLQPDAEDLWLKRGSNGYYSLLRCPRHGAWFARFKLARPDGLHWQVARVYEKPTDAQLERWAKEKRLYFQRLKKRAEAEAAQGQGAEQEQSDAKE